MKKYDITTKKGQRELLKNMIDSYNLGYEKGEEEIKAFNEGYIQALKDILGESQERFIINGFVFSNYKKDFEKWMLKHG